MLGLLSSNTTINLCECLINVSWSNGFAPGDVVRRQRVTFCWILKNRVHSCFPLFNTTEVALHCKNDSTLSQNALSTKDLILIQFFKSYQIWPRDFGSLSSVPPKSRIFIRRTQMGQNKKWSRRKKLLSNFCLFCTEKADKGPNIKKNFGGPLILSESRKVKKILHISVF
jgi:hypothetical protein